MEESADKTDYCFVLISPDSKLDPLWDAVISPAIQQTGMIPAGLPDWRPKTNSAQLQHFFFFTKVLLAVFTGAAGEDFFRPFLKRARSANTPVLCLQERGEQQPLDLAHLQLQYLEYDPQDFSKSCHDLASALVNLRRSAENLKPVLIPHPSPTPWADRGLSPLPVTLKQLEIRDFQCIQSTGIDDLPSDAPWILITGDNGDGKTSLLQALAIGLNGTEDAAHLLKDNAFAHIGVALQEGKHSIVRDFVRWDKHWTMTDHTGQKEIAPLSNLLAYGPSRLNISDEESTASGKSNRGPVYTLLHQRGNLRNIEYWLKMCALSASTDPDGREAQRAEAVKKLLVELMPGVTSMVLKGSTFQYTEKGHTVSLNSLSSGQTSLLAMVGDLLIRFYETQPDIVDPKELQGIVLIDELDIHLHPSRQKALPSQLSHIFPNVQFIATTHSVIPILGAPPGSVFLRVVREPEKGTQVERLEIEVANLLPNALLTSPLFEMPSLRAVQNKKLADVYTDDAYEEIERKKRVDEALDRLAQAGNILPKGFLESEE